MLTTRHVRSGRTGAYAATSPTGSALRYTLTVRSEFWWEEEDAAHIQG
jgi:hypothetical protein